MPFGFTWTPSGGWQFGGSGSPANEPPGGNFPLIDPRLLGGAGQGFYTPPSGAAPGQVPYPSTITPPDADIPPVTFPPEGPPYTESGDLTSPSPGVGELTPVPPAGNTDVLEPVTPPGSQPIGTPPGPGDTVAPTPDATGGNVFGGDQGIYGPYVPGGPYRKRTRRGQRGGKIPKGGMDQSFPGLDYGRFPKVQFPQQPRPRPGAPPIYRFPGPVLNAPPAPKAPDEDETDRERPPLFPPDEEPANDTSIRRPPVQQVEPVRVPDPAGVRAPFPQPPPRVELPGVPQVGVTVQPPEKVAPWPAQPSSVPTGQQTIPAPARVPSSISLPGASPAPKARRLPLPVVWSLPIVGLELLAGFVGRGLPSVSPSGIGPVSPTTPLPPPVPGVTTIPTVLPAPATGVQPVTVPSTGILPSPAPLTGVGPLSVESGAQCETPSQTRNRRQRNRENCERFITVTIPKHKRRVCAAEAGRLIGRKLGKQIGKSFGKLLKRGRSGSSSRTTTTRKRSSRRARESPIRVTKRGNVELPGGFGIELPKQMRPKLPGRIPRL